MRLSVLGLVAVAVAAAGCTSSSSSTDRSVLMAGDHFRVVSLRMLHPKQLAPMLIVNTTHYVGLAHATASILHDLNGRYGDRYEGFYFEARDELGVPFFITETLRRDRTEGGQWARSEALYPFLHG
jgi:hypothetical protein